MDVGGSFEFTLSTGNTVVQTDTNKSGMVTFDQITFQTSGTYTYTINEVRGNDDGIDYDPHTETITITVADDGFGQSGRVDYMNDSDLMRPI